MKKILTTIAVLGTALLLFLIFSTPSYNSLFITLDNVEGLPNGSFVKIKGLEVGHIDNITFKNNSIIGTLYLDKDVEVPVDSKFKINEIEISNAKYIEIEPSQRKDVYHDGDTVSVYTPESLFGEGFGRSLGKFIDVLKSISDTNNFKFVDTLANDFDSLKLKINNQGKKISDNFEKMKDSVKQK